MTPADQAVAELVRVEGSRLLATLARTVGDLRLAEDAVQEAVEKALRQWPGSGVPTDARAWLSVVARNKAIDLIRRENRRADKELEAVQLMSLIEADEPSARTVRDDQLRLIFTCCHPALSLQARVALALRVLCGLSVAQIAACLLTNETAMAKRLTRTRTKIAKAGIPYTVPSDADLPARLAAVCAVIHALYTAGHTAAEGERLGDIELSAEAIRLGRRLVDLMPDETAPAAVLALMLLTEARRPARLDQSGAVLVLAEQDRSRWDRSMIAEGIALLNWSLNRSAGLADPYQLQASLAAQHALAPSYAETDWPEILRLYDLLLAAGANPAVSVNRAVALAELDGPDAALAELDALAATGLGPAWELDARTLAVRAELHARAARWDQAVAAITESISRTANTAEHRYRTARLDEWSARLDEMVRPVCGEPLSRHLSDTRTDSRNRDQES
jgi:RNA polymerase sigma-70 factor (ECF subfamily)